MTPNKRILIFGAGGFIGSAVSDALSARAGHEVFKVFSPRSTSDELVGRYAADISDIESVSDVVGAVSPDVIINAAGRAHHREGEPIEPLYAANVDGAANVVRAASDLGVGRVVHLSSVMVYGHAHASLIDESTPTDPIGDYAQSKMLGELAATKLAEGSHMALTVLRLAMVPAVKNYSNLRDLSDALSAGRFRWVGNGRNRKSMLTRKDLTDAILAIVDSEREVKGVETFNLSSGSISMLELVEALAEGLGAELPRTRIPIWSARVIAALLGGSFGVPTPERLAKFLSDDRISASLFSEFFRFTFKGDVREALLKYARERTAAASTPEN